MTALETRSVLATPAHPVGDVAAHRPLDLRAVRLTTGALADWQTLNASATIPHCITNLETSGVIDNLRRVIGESGAAYRGFVFADSDLYKVVEAVAWEIARTGTTEHDAWLDDVIGLVARVQEPSGYVMSWIQGVHPEKKFAELEWTHEMYVLGHMVQAAVALDRANGRTDLLDIARAFVDLVDRRFGPGRDAGICGHPEIETALVELYRHTGERRYLTLAERMIDLRGAGLLPVGGLGARYFQDQAPVRESRDAVGHAVRQLYLNAGVTDAYLENSDPTLLSAMDSQWASVHERKMYLSGAFGSRHRDEAFGDDYELPSERAYAETCATIADLHWTWRMLLAGGTAGAARYAETIEREVHNALAASIDATGTRFFYSNPLQQRPDRYSEENAPRERTPWYACACCPPNIARTVAQMSAYVATSTTDTLWLHQFAAAEIDLPAHLGEGVLRVATAYPAEGAVEITVHGRVAAGARLAVRVPSWSPASTVAAADGAAPESAGDDGYAHVDLVAGATYRLDLDLTPRWTRGHHRVDAVRGCLALERGPVVFCIEQASLPDGAVVDDLMLVAGAPVEVSPRELSVTVTSTSSDDLYAASTRPAGEATTFTVPAIPFSTWGNAGPGAMRVWLPTRT
ncbi:beta-L-arabinofuranosidase domain-containing protein [Sanguibacter sp. 25GB23B1]|uniref:glycoside hydrolase family 127 protein n=1 Tax=unclassified Sanguibacter TaxID=2645534 RepID=UPI0032AEBA21